MTPTNWSLIYRNDPYADFPAHLFTLDLQGSNLALGVFDSLIEEVQPRVIVEIGSWKGASAVGMADALKRYRIDGRILCIDTWLGALELWTNDLPDLDCDRALDLCHGFPQVYFQFLANVVLSGHQDVIVPVPNTSQTAAKLLKRRGVRPDLVYIAASHEEDDFRNDLMAYWDLLAPRPSVMFGDKYGDSDFPGIRAAVDRFAHERELPLSVIDGWCWVLRKTLAATVVPGSQQRKSSDVCGKQKQGPTSADLPREAEGEDVARFAAHCQIFVLHHGSPPNICRPYLESVHLGKLDLPPHWQNNCLGESRLFLCDLPTGFPQSYLGFTSGRWDEKMPALPRLGELHRLEAMLAPHRVLAPLVSPGRGWVTQSDEAHPGLGRLVWEMADVAGTAIGSGPTIWANNFLCHRDLYCDFIAFWRKLFDHFYGRYGLDPPFLVGDFDRGRKMAYLAERFTMLYFAGRRDIEIVQIPAQRRP